MKIKNKILMLLFFCISLFSFGISNVNAAGEHQFIVQTYDWNALDNDWEGSGSGEEIISGSVIKPGQVFQASIYYIPGDDTDLGFQMALLYDNTILEPLTFYDEESGQDTIYVETDMSTTYQGGMWPAAGTSPSAKKQTNWTVISNHVANTAQNTSKFNFLVSDETNSKELETEGVIASVYFKVKDNAPSGSTINLSFDKTYTAMGNKSALTTSGPEFTVQADVSSNTALHTLIAKGNGVNYTSPDFVADDNTIKTYNIIVPNAVSSIDLQATPTDGKTTVTGTGTKTLNVGNNNKFSITSTAQSGALEIYEIIVHRLNNDATLSNLSVTGGIDIGTFNKDTLSYTATVPYKTTGTTVSATAADTKATVTGAGTFNFTNYGNTPNVKEVVVKAEDCDSRYVNVEGNTCTSKTYTITVNRTAPSSNKNLSELKVNDVLVNGFDKATLEYTLDDIKTDVTSLNVKAVAEDSNASVEITGANEIKVGNNTITIKVTAEDKTSQTYKINVKKLSSDNTLKSLSVNKGTLDPGFTSENKTYTVIMDKDVTVFNKDMITAVANHSGATIEYDTEKTLNTETTTAFTITVKAENEAEQTYTLNVKRSKNDDATLKSLTVSHGTLNPVFSASTTSYTVNVGNEITSIVVTGEATDSNANVAVTGGDTLKVGNNQVKVTVTSESGSKKEYTVNVVRAGSSDADLKEIKIDGNLIAGFDKDTLVYTLADIETDITSLNVIATANHSEADVVITGANAIKVGNNTITIKVTAEDGTTTKTYTLNVKKLSNDNTLKSLSVNKGTLEPGFTSENKIYTVTMEEDVTVFNKDMITAVANHSEATIVYDSEKTINGDTTTAFTITVTAENGDSETYTLNVIKTKNSDATLKSLTVSHGTLTPSFSAGTKSYTVNVENDVTSIEVDAEATNLSSNVEITGGNNLVIGNNTVKVTVTSESGNNEVYTITVVRAASNDADLKEIKIDGNLIAGFDKDTLEYTLDDIKTDITSLNVTATANHSEADVVITGHDAIKVGNNTITIKVTAEDGTTTKTYTLNVKKLSNDNTLKSLSVNKGTLEPGFTSGNKTYTVTMEEDVTVFNESMITAVANHSEATIEYDTEKALNSDTTTPFTITVTAENGSEQTYTLNVKKEKNSNATLKSLTVSHGTLTPAFSAGTKAYTVNVENDVTSIEVNAEATDSTAVVTVEGGDTLVVGNNTVTITVKSESGDENKYVVNVVRAGSSDADLKEIKIDGTLIDGFDKDTLEYTLSDIETDIVSLNVTALANHSEADVVITGHDAIKVGNNTITIKVTAEDGTTTKTYTLNVKKLSNDNTLKSLSVNKGTLEPEFTSENKTYTVTMEEDVTVFNKDMITAVTNHSEATIVYDSEKTLNTETTEAFTITVTAENGESDTYVLNVKKSKNSDATLKSLTVSHGTLTPAFSAGTKAYTVNVENDVTSIEVNAEANNSKASITTTGGDNLVVGNNTVTVSVTSESGSKNDYVITVVRAGNSNASLSDLKVNGETVTGFNKDTLEYTLAKVTYETSKINVTATTEHEKATVTGTGDINLTTGPNTVEIKVTAEDGTVKTYKLNVEREKNSDATLQSLSIGEFALTPNFDKNTFEYTITVTELTETLKQSDVKAVATDAKTTITFDGDLALSSKQDNYYNIKVVAEDGTSTNTYKVKVIKPKSSNADLKSLSISGGTLTPVFAATQKTYDVVMPNEATKFNKDMITAEASHSEATITYSEEIAIDSETAKEFVITVTAENGTTNTYKLNVKASAEEVLKQITSTKHKIEGNSIKTVKLYETVLELKNNLDNENEYLEIWSADEKTKITDDQKLATGMIVKLIQDGKEIDRKLVIIKGDTSGDGEIDLFDAVKILNHYLEKTPLVNAYVDAAYVNNDDSVDLFDAVMILNHYLGKTLLH